MTSTGTGRLACMCQESWARQQALAMQILVLLLWRCGPNHLKKATSAKGAKNN